MRMVCKERAEERVVWRVRVKGEGVREKAWWSGVWKRSRMTREERKMMLCGE